MVDVLSSQSGAMDEGLAATLRERYGLDKPMPVQLLRYVEGLISGDLGYSHRNSAPVLTLILSGFRLPDC